MYIRYQYVRNFVVGVGSLSIFSLCGWGMCGPSDEAESPAKVTVSAPATSGKSALSDAKIIARAETPATPKGKIKDAFPGPVKVNIYEDTGDAVWDRIKIDHNRDETWDAQWTRKDGAWTRDDGQRWSGAGWGDTAPAVTQPAVPSPNKPAAPVELSNTKPAAELSELVDLMLHQRATSEKIKDLKRGAGPKINVYDDDKNGTWDRAKVDHDRDEKWDESWTVKAGHIERKKEDSGVVYLFHNGAWVKK
jgi:hypothetical protein